MTLTQHDIVREAIALLDEDGLEGLSLRRLAQRLAVRAPTLYWYVRDKRELLDLMAAEMFRETFEQYRFPLPGQPWAEWLAQRARSLRAALLAHRDSVRVLAGNRPPPVALVEIERALGGLVDAGFLPEEALLALLSLAAFVMGEVLDVQGEAARPRPAPVDGLTGEEPGIVLRLLAAAAPVFGDPDERFEFGLRLLIDGLGVRLSERPAAARSNDAPAGGRTGSLGA